MWATKDLKMFYFTRLSGRVLKKSGYTNNLKNQDFEKMKEMPRDIITFHNCTKNHHQCYTVPEIWHMTDVICIFHFVLFFFPFNPLTAQKTLEIPSWRYPHFTHVYQKL